MARVFNCLSELTEVSPEVAWKLVDILFQQQSALIMGGIVFAAFVAGKSIASARQFQNPLQPDCIVAYRRGSPALHCHSDADHP
jgi:hypothetical protein